MPAIHIFGDSHAHFTFQGLGSHFKRYEFLSHHQYSTTMHRVGRDQHIINCQPDTIDKRHDIIIVVYGEIDCRCHIQRQINKGRELDEIVQTLVDAYITSILQYGFHNVIVVAVPPPVSKNEFEKRNGPIQHHLPFVGTDKDRVLYTTKVNHLLEEQCARNGLLFSNPFHSYISENGTMDFSKTDGLNHVGNNTNAIEEIKLCIKKLISTSTDLQSNSRVPNQSIID